MSFLANPDNITINHVLLFCTLSTKPQAFLNNPTVVFEAPAGPQSKILV